MLWIQLLSIVGLLLAFGGSFYLSARVLFKIKSLQEIIGDNIDARLRAIATTYEDEQNSSKAVKEIIEFLNLMFVDYETAQTDTTQRSRIGMFLLIAGTCCQGVAILVVLFS